MGVARALGADPDVLLMDEPFGAIDPITRDRLQNEFLRLQGELKKTIVFVTHDIDEAVKMGDRIAILREQCEIAQLDKPEHILTDPADEFVENFLGSGAILKTLTLRRVKDIELSPLVTLKEPVHRDQALREMSEANTAWLSCSIARPPDALDRREGVEPLIFPRSCRPPDHCAISAGRHPARRPLRDAHICGRHGGRRRWAWALSRGLHGRKPRATAHPNRAGACILVSTAVATVAEDAEAKPSRRGARIRWI